MVVSRLRAALKPLARPAMTTLAASRLTSHSQGAGSVSSKSLASKTRRRSGEAKRPKLEMWASPHACTMMSVRGVLGEVDGHHRGCTTVVGEGRLRHARVAQREQLREPIGLLASEHGDGVAVGWELERGVAPSRHPLAQQATLCHAYRWVDPGPGSPGIPGGRRRRPGLLVRGRFVSLGSHGLHLSRRDRRFSARGWPVGRPCR